MNRQKPVSFCHYIKSQLQHILPFESHEYFGDDFKERFVIEMRELKTNLYIFSVKQTLNQIWKRAKKKIQKSKKTVSSVDKV